MLKKIAFAMLVGGLLTAPLGAAAKKPYPAERDGVDYGVHVAKADGKSAIPEQLDRTDYAIEVTA